MEDAPSSQEMRVVAYYTDDPVYTRAAEYLRQSLDARKAPHTIKKYPATGWVEATCLKPRFILDCLHAYPGEVLVYTDADSCLVQDDLKGLIARELPEAVDVGFVKSHWGEVLSGTIVFRPTPGATTFVEAWIAAIGSSPINLRIPDQAPFSRLARGKHPGFTTHCLHPRWCKIFDLMRDIADPVFMHYQASRVHKHNNHPKAIESLFARLGVH